MELWNYDVDRDLFKRVGMRAFRQCDAFDRTRTSRGVESERCGGAAMRGATWEGRTEGRHSALLCDRHTVEYLGPMIRDAN